MQKEKRVCGRLRRANTKRHKEHGASERVAELKSEDRRLKKIRGGYIYIYIYKIHFLYHFLQYEALR